MAFCRMMRENTKNFASDVSKISREINSKVRNNEDMSEQDLLGNMLVLFCYLFISTDNSNIHTDFAIHNGDFTVSLGIAVSEGSNKNCEADILVEVRKPAYELSNKDSMHLMNCMYLAKAPWGILSNGHKMYVYKLEDMVSDYSLEGQPILSIDMDNLTDRDLFALKQYTDSCFSEIEYIRSIKEADFVKEGIKRIEKGFVEKPPYNRLFFFDEALTKLNPCDSVNYFADSSNQDLFNEILIKSNDYFALGIDLVSIQSFMRLNAQDRKDFMEFHSEFKKMVHKIFSMRSAKADVVSIDAVFLEDFSRLMGYDFKSILMSGENVSKVCRTANVAFSSDIPFKLIVYSTQEIQTECSQFYEDLGNDSGVIVETNFETYVIRLADQKDAYLIFDLTNMTFGNLYDLFLLSSKKFSTEVYDRLDKLSRQKMTAMNNCIVNNYKNRFMICNQTMKALYGLKKAGFDVYMPEGLIPKQSNESEEINQKIQYILNWLSVMNPIVDMMTEQCSLKEELALKKEAGDSVGVAQVQQQIQQLQESLKEKATLVNAL